MPDSHPTPQAQAPTRRQLAYLRALATSRGQTFQTPRTVSEASAEIRRLTNTAASTPAERRVERDQDRTTAAVDATAVRYDEVKGHGANAHWAHTQHPAPAETVAAAVPGRELGHYELSDGSVRLIVGERIGGRVAVRDVPAGQHGRVYLIERQIESQAALTGLVQAYIEDSLTRDEPAALVPRRFWDGDDA